MSSRGIGKFKCPPRYECTAPGNRCTKNDAKLQMNTRCVFRPTSRKSVKSASSRSAPGVEASPFRATTRTWGGKPGGGKRSSIRARGTRNAAGGIKLRKRVTANAPAEIKRDKRSRVSAAKSARKAERSPIKPRSRTAPKAVSEERSPVSAAALARQFSRIYEAEGKKPIGISRYPIYPPPPFDPQEPSAPLYDLFPATDPQEPSAPPYYLMSPMPSSRRTSSNSGSYRSARSSSGSFKSGNSARSTTSAASVNNTNKYTRIYAVDASDSLQKPSVSQVKTKKRPTESLASIAIYLKQFMGGRSPPSPPPRRYSDDDIEAALRPRMPVQNTNTNKRQKPKNTKPVLELEQKRKELLGYATENFKRAMIKYPYEYPDYKPVSEFISLRFRSKNPHPDKINALAKELVSRGKAREAELKMKSKNGPLQQHKVKQTLIRMLKKLK